MTEPTVCASAIMTSQNVAYETERLIAEALYHLRPVYMAFPDDLADQMMINSARPLDPPISDPSPVGVS
jgi:indolepyruvate decarboxylase